MNNGPDRRRTDTDAARQRRNEQQQSWEESHPQDSDHISERFAQALGALIDASRRLPVCNRSATLHAALTGFCNADNRAAARAAARRLLDESELALEEDPWFRFHRAASEAEATLGRAA